MDAKSLLGTTIADNYELLSIAGVGGMGTVFKARQIGLDRFVAVKVLDPQQVSSEDSLLRFEREAKSISQLSHVHIARFYAYGIEDNALPYIVMEWLDGLSLLSLIHSDEQLNAERAIKIVMQIADALACAHESGIVHRDLKPANVLLLKEPHADFVKVVDFGLARIESSLEADPQKLTKTGSLLGTPQYLSPEQCLGNRADLRSDVYALGCILYELLCGSPPFDAENAIGLIHQHVNSPLVPVSRRTSKPLPEGLEQVVAKCLEKTPEQRYQLMAALNEDLKKVLQGDRPEIQLSKTHSRKKKILLMSAIVLSAGLGALLLPGLLFNDLARCRVSLSQDHCEKNVFFWQKKAEQYEMDGKSELSSLIETEVDRSLNLANLDSEDACELCLKLAKQFAEKKQKHSAARFAMLAIRRSMSLSRKQVAAIVDQACTIMIQARVQLKTDDLRWLAEFGIAQHNSFEELGKEKIFVFLIANASRLRTSIRPTQLLLLVRGRDYAFINKNDMSMLEESVPATLKSLNQTGQSPWEPAYHLAKLGRMISAVSPANWAIARRYMKQCLAEVEKLQAQGLRNDTEYSSILENLSAAESSMGNGKKSIEYAQKSVDIVNSPHFRTQLARALQTAGKNSEAIVVAKNAFEELKESSAVEHEKTETAAVLTRAMFAAKMYPELLAFVGKEINDTDKNRESLPVGFLFGILSGLSRVNLQASERTLLFRYFQDLVRLASSSEKLDLQTNEMELLIDSGEMTLYKNQLSTWIQLLKAGGSSSMLKYWAVMVNSMSKLREAGDIAGSEQIFEVYRSRFLSLLKRKELDPGQLADMASRIYVHGMKAESDALYDNAQANLAFDFRKVFVPEYLDRLMAWARKKPVNYPEAELRLSKAIAQEPLRPENWPTRRYLGCLLNEVFQQNGRYSQALANMKELEYYERKFNSKAVNGPVLFEIESAIAYQSFQLGDFKTASAKIQEISRLSNVDRAWELPRIWYIYATLWEPFKRKGELAGAAAIRELVRDGYLKSVESGKIDWKFLRPVRRYIRDLKEENLLKELDASSEKYLSAEDYMHLIEAGK